MTDHGHYRINLNLGKLLGKNLLDIINASNEFSKIRNP
jgi:hypothetical protein